jgi:hypothetical protein
MRTQMKRARRWRLLLALTVSLSAADAAFAQQHGGSERSGGGQHQHVDNRFSHNHSYFDRGYAMHEGPRSGYALDHGREHYWYDRGEWYRRGGPDWVVVGAPVGAFVSVLPPFYTTVWYSGVPYYYANDTYYSWNGGNQEYEVVAPPAGIDSGGTTQTPPSDGIFVYPKNGQSSEQQARDRYECHHSAVEQTGYDATQAGGGVTPEVAAGKRTDYFRAQAACLDARGYSVR